MKSINFFLVIAALFLIGNTGFAQSSKAKEKAIKSVEKINSQLQSENHTLALTEAQIEQIVALQMKQMEELSAYRENNPDKEVVKTKSKELKKATTAKIRDEIFTPEQAKAQKDYRKKMKGTKGEKVAKAGKKSKQPKAPVEKMTAAEADQINASASDKDKSKAEKSTEKLNARLIAADANLGLSADQKKQINILNLKRQVERSKMTAAGVSKDEMKVKGKELNKSNKQIIKSILTKEQNAALKAAKGQKKK